MEIALKAQSDGSVLIEEYKVKYPFSLYCDQTNTKNILWDDKELTAFAYSGLSKNYPIHIYFQRKIDISDFDDASKKLDFSSLDKDLYKPPATKILTEPQFNLDKSLYNTLQGTSSVTGSNSHNHILNKVHKGWMHTEVTMKPDWKSGVGGGHQNILFEKKYFALVGENDTYSKFTAKPRIKKLPYFLLKNTLEEIQKTVEFSFEFNDPTKKISSEYMKLWMRLRLKNE